MRTSMEQLIDDLTMHLVQGEGRELVQLKHELIELDGFRQELREFEEERQTVADALHLAQTDEEFYSIQLELRDTEQTIEDIRYELNKQKSNVVDAFVKAVKQHLEETL